MMYYISKLNQQLSFKNKFMLFLGLVAMVTLSSCAQTNGVMWPSAAVANSVNPVFSEKMGANLAAAAENKELTCQKSALSDQILATAYSQLGKKYKFGGTSPETGFDCAGFVQWVYKQYGYQLPRTSREHLNIGKEVARDELLPGDILVYYRGRGRRGTHVGIYTGNGKFIHSPHSGDYVREAKAFDRYRSAHFIKAVRVLNDQEIRTLTPEQKEALKTAARNGKFLADGNDKYRVKKGDTLSVIAQRSGITPNDLVEANNLNQNPMLHIGQQLVVPKSKAETEHASASFSQKKQQAKASGQADKKQSQPGYYQIVGGDTLSTIAKKTGVSLKELKQANNISSKTVLRIGQKLKIPGQTETTDVTVKTARNDQFEPTQKTVEAKIKNKAKVSSYTVKQGDTISQVAQKYDLSSKDLLAANNLTGNNTLRVGQKLVVPGGNVTVSSKANAHTGDSPQQVKIAKVYKVKKGDTISTIAHRSGVSTQTLLKVNDLDKDHMLKIGQQIAIP